MVNKFLYPRGGSESYMLYLSEYLKKMGHEVEYFGMFDENNTVGNSAGLYTQNMDFHSKGLARFLYPFKIIYSFEAKKKIFNIPENEPLYKIIKSRTINTAKIKNKEEREYWQEMKRINEIPQVYLPIKEINKRLQEFINNKKGI